MENVQCLPLTSNNDEDNKCCLHKNTTENLKKKKWTKSNSWFLFSKSLHIRDQLSNSWFLFSKSLHIRDQLNYSQEMTLRLKPVINKCTIHHQKRHFTPINLTLQNEPLIQILFRLLLITKQILHLMCDKITQHASYWWLYVEAYQEIRSCVRILHWRLFVIPSSTRGPAKSVLRNQCQELYYFTVRIITSLRTNGFQS